jgi:hypothetical protein
VDETENQLPTINPLEEAFLSRYIAKGFLAIAVLLGQHDVALVSKDGFAGVSDEISITALMVGSIALHFICARISNAHLFTLGRLVQAGHVAVQANKMPNAPAALPAPPAVIPPAPSVSSTPTHPTPPPI